MQRVKDVKKGLMKLLGEVAKYQHQHNTAESPDRGERGVMTQLLEK